MGLIVACLLSVSTHPTPACHTPRPAEQPARELHQVVPAVGRVHGWRV